MEFTVSGVFEDLKFKILEGYDQNCFTGSALLDVSAKMMISTQLSSFQLHNWGHTIFPMYYVQKFSDRPFVFPKSYFELHREKKFPFVDGFFSGKLKKD